MPDPTLLSLPAEIRSLILYQCPDFDTLRALILTCHSFYSVFQSERRNVLLATFDRVIPKDVQGVAISALCATRNRAMGKNVLVVDMTNDHDMEAANSLMPLQPGSKDFCDLSRAHKDVTSVAEHLYSHVFAFVSKRRETGEDDEPPPNATEAIRIQRALYRIDIFGYFQSSGLAPLDIRDELLLDLTPWELDELGCVYDFLCNRVAFLSERISEAHVRGEEEYYRCLASPPAMPRRSINHWSEPIVLRGIAHCALILQTADSKENSEAQRLEDLGEILDSYPEEPRRAMLGWALWEKDGVVDTELADNLNNIDSDGISGPNAAWKLTRADKTPQDWYRTIDERLAKWCAFIWDDERLERWRAFDVQHPLTSPHADWTMSHRQSIASARQERMARDPLKPSPMPCAHGNNTSDMPSAGGTLFYRGSSKKGNHEFSTCGACLQDIEEKGKPAPIHSFKVVRYG